MPANLYPYVVSDPVLRSCRHRVHQGDRRVAAPAMCSRHQRTCLTCCGRQGRSCVKEPWAVPVANYFPDMTWEERQADMAKLNRELGFPDYTEAQLAEDEIWRTR